MFDPIIHGASLVALLIVGSIILQPGAGEALGNHMVPLVLLGLAWLLWKPIFWALKLVGEGFFLGEGVKLSGVLRRRRNRS